MKRLRPRSFVLLAASASLLAAGWLLTGRSTRGTAALEPLREEGVSRAGQGEPLEAEALAVPVARVFVPEAGDPLPRSARSGLGHLSIRAIDAETGAGLDRVRVRAASPSRFADRESASGNAEIQLTLTPGSYSLLVLSRGYEALELPAVEIAPAQSVTLDAVRMYPGSAAILGLVRGDPRGLHAELLGDGRRPCPSCLGVPTTASSTAPYRDEAWLRADPCPACGFAHKASRRAIPLDGRFTFDRLVSGIYALRLADAQDRTVGLPQTLVLRAGELLPAEFDAASLRVVELELFGADGRSLSAEWAQRLRRRVEPDPPELEVVEWGPEPAEFACTFRAGEVCLARAVLIPPPPLDGASGGGTAIGAGSFHGRRLGSSGRPAADDRPRASGEALALEPRTPVIEPSTVDASVGPDGRARFEPLPAIELSLEISSGPLSARVAVPASRERTRVRAQLSR